MVLEEVHRLPNRDAQSVLQGSSPPVFRRPWLALPPVAGASARGWLAARGWCRRLWLVAHSALELAIARPPATEMHLRLNGYG